MKVLSITATENRRWEENRGIIWLPLNRSSSGWAVTKETGHTGATDVHVLMEMKYSVLQDSGSDIPFPGLNDIAALKPSTKPMARNVIRVVATSETLKLIVDCLFPSPQTTGRAQTYKLNCLKQWNLAGNLKIYGGLSSGCHNDCWWGTRHRRRTAMKTRVLLN